MPRAERRDMSARQEKVARGVFVQQARVRAVSGRARLGAARAHLLSAQPNLACPAGLTSSQRQFFPEARESRATQSDATGQRGWKCSRAARVCQARTLLTPSGKCVKKNY